MKLSAPALAITAAVIWGAAILVIGSVGILAPGYGDTVLSLVASIYPGYDNSGAFSDLLLGVLYAFVDGLVGGFVFAVLYNKMVDLTARPGTRSTGPESTAVESATPDSAAAESAPSAAQPPANEPPAASPPAASPPAGET